MSDIPITLWLPRTRKGQNPVRILIFLANVILIPVYGKHVRQHFFFPCSAGLPFYAISQAVLALGTDKTGTVTKFKLSFIIIHGRHRLCQCIENLNMFSITYHLTMKRRIGLSICKLYLNIGIYF